MKCDLCLEELEGTDEVYDVEKPKLYCPKCSSELRGFGKYKDYKCTNKECSRFFTKEKIGAKQ